MKQDVIKALVTPFPAEAIRSRRGAHGENLHYIETWRVIDRLNTAFEHCWAFRILEWKLMENEVVVHVELEAGGLVKQAFGASSITRSRDSGDPVSIGDDIKSAASDGLKKAGTLFGVALHLYGEDVQEPMETSKKVDQDNPDREDWNPHRLTERQRTAILAISARKGIDEDDLDGWVRKSLGVPLDELTRRQASELITKLNNGNGSNGRAVGGVQ